MCPEGRGILTLTAVWEANNIGWEGNPTRSWVCRHNQITFSVCVCHKGPLCPSVYYLTHQLTPDSGRFLGEPLAVHRPYACKYIKAWEHDSKGTVQL